MISLHMRRHAAAFVLCVLSIGSSPTAPAAVGVTLGSPDVTADGIASYSIPLSLPPGTNGLTPSLSLRYSHTQGNGLLGIGWSLVGLSAIARCHKTIAQDGAISAATLATSDGYCLDGNRLRLTGGTYGTAGSTDVKRSPDFFMSAAGEYEPLSAPRACWTIARLRDARRDDYMLIEIEPALEVQHQGMRGKKLCHLVIASRHRGQTLYPISEWPTFVYVARVLDDAVVNTLEFKDDQVETIAWATLFRTLQEASNQQMRVRG